jgi:phosphodiesterase/alkaline phosphatase D-like protein/mono/diheme cytochrome c family protein
LDRFNVHLDVHQRRGSFVKRTRYHVIPLAALMLWASIAMAYPNLSPASRTGAATLGGVAAESNCAGCHSGTLNQSGGSVSVLGAPVTFSGGSTHRLTVRLASTHQSGGDRAWAFEITAVDTVTGQGVGTFAVVNATETGLKTGTGAYESRTYVTQTSAGLKTGAASPVEWQVDWTAPTASTNPVRFFAIGMASDGSGSGGDYCYTTSVTTSAAPATAPFTLVIIPDTQFYTAQTNGGTMAMYTAQTQWVVDNRVSRNIAAVAHLGDMTDNDNTTEWQRAETAMAILENPATTGLTYGIPYVPCFGNHDDNSGGTLYDQYFGVSRFSGRSYYGGHYGSNNKNHYILFSAGGLDWVMVSLQFHPDEVAGALDWADGIFASYPNRKGILITHSMLYPGLDWSPGGENIYNALKDRPNLILAASGHLNGSNYRTDVYNGNKLTTMVSNYQGDANGGNGYLRYLEIDPALNQVRAFTYSPYAGTSMTDAFNQYVLNDVPLGGGAPTVPAAPVATAGTSVTQSGFAANWNASSGASSYRLDVSMSSSFTSYVAGYQDLTVSGTSQPVSGLAASTPYYYRVRAVNAAGTSGNSNTITVTTSAPATPPAAPVATAATGVTTTGFQANWNASGGATSYRLDVSADEGFATFVVGYQDLTVSSLSQAVSGLTASTSYYYRVRAVNAYGTSGNSNTITLDTSSIPTPPAAPVATAGTSVTSSSFTANWGTSSGATSYRLDVSTGSGFATYVAGYQDLTVSGLSQAVIGLAASTPYYYRVRAVNDDGTSGSSNTITVTTSAAPGPSGVRISQVYGGGVYWNGSGSPPAAGYYQCDYVELFNSSSSPVNIGGWSLQYGSSTGSTFGSSTWNTVLIPSGATVPACGYYLIRGYCSNVGGAALPVTADLVTSTVSPPGSFSTASAAGKFALFSDQVTGRTCATAQSSGKLVDLIGWGGANCYEGANAAASDDNSVLARALGGMTDTGNNSTDFSKLAVSGVTIHNSSSATNPDCSGPPEPPAAPVATAATDVGSSGFTANWNASSGAAIYRLDVSTNSGFSSYVPGYQDLTVSGLGQAVSGLASSTPYYYRVRAVNAGGTSGNSNTITVTTSAVPPAEAVRISQVYGGGVYWNGTGDPPAAGHYQCDYVELFNSSSSPVNIGGWSLQYGSSTGSTFGSSTWNTVLIPSGATVPACGYYLIKGYCSNVGGAALPVTADLSTSTTSPPGSFSTASAAGKFALFSDQVAGRTCATAQSSGKLVDLIGWGGANCYEGASAAASDDNSVLARALGGMTDTGNNSADFAKVAASGVTIHNSSSGQNPDCDANAPPNAPTLIVPLNGAIDVAVPATLEVTVSDADADAMTVQFYGRPVPPPPPIPAAPVAMAGTSVGSTSFTANWNASSDATSYRLDVSTDSGFGSYVAGYQDLTVSGLSQAVSGLAASTPYYYRVRAVNSSGTSGNSNSITVTTGSTPPPAAPVATAGTGVTSTGFQANWNAASGATSYRLDVATDNGFTSYVAGYQDLTVAGVSQAVSGLTASTPYYYRVRAVGAGGTSGNSNVITVTTSGTGSAECEVIILPDTQEYTSQMNGGNINMFTAQTQWIVNNRVSRNIVGVSNVGDIVDSWTDPAMSTQYNLALTATNLLENPVTTGLPDGIPYAMLMGNHDFEDHAKFNSVYGVSRFTGRGYYGGHYGTANDCSYILFSGGGRDFVLVAISYAPTAAELTWAKGVLDLYPNRVGIVSSHGILNESQTIPAPWNADGSAIYNALKSTTNLRLMVCGHMSAASSSPSWHGEGRRMDLLNNGKTVTSLLADYQDRGDGGGGRLRILQFVPATNKVRVRTYSPYNNVYETDSDSSSQFTLDVDLSMPQPQPAPQAVSAPARPEAALADFALLGTVAGVPSGTTASWLWDGLDPLTEYEWYVTVSDGQASPVTGPTWSFTTAAASSGVGDWGYGGLALAPPAPNPTRGALRFSFDLPRAMHARLEVLDVQGRLMAVLAEGDFGAGRQERTWDASVSGGPAGAGARAGAGVYFVRLVTPQGRLVRRVALLR